MKKCKVCGKGIDRISPKANNKKFCSVLCRNSTYKKYRAEFQRKRQDTFAMTQTKGKIACLICGRFYRKPVSHAYQKHEVNEREYKKLFGLDHKKGIITPQAKEKLQEHIKNNFDSVVAFNLLKKGKQTRFKKNHKINYQRSPQTLLRLKTQFKNAKQTKKTHSRTQSRHQGNAKGTRQR